MAKCMQCQDGVIECGPIPSELCQPSSGFEFAGVFCFRVFVNQGPSGKCKVRIVPCLPKGTVTCEKARKSAKKAAKKATRNVTGRAR
jgi:hypothetical protein